MVTGAGSESRAPILHCAVTDVEYDYSAVSLVDLVEDSLHVPVFAESDRRMFDDHLPIPDSEDDLTEAKQNAGKRVGIWRRRSIFATGVLLLSCAAVAPFSKGGALHQYAEPFGRLFVVLALGSFLALVYCVALLWGAWSALCALK